jgi:hypothetical protein
VPGIPADPARGVPLRDELARGLIERRLGVREDPVDSPTWSNRHTAGAPRRVLKRPEPGGNSLGNDWNEYTSHAKRRSGEEDWEGNY